MSCPLGPKPYQLSPVTGDTTEAVIERVRQVIDDERVKITPLPVSGGPSAVSAGDAESSSSSKLLSRSRRE